MDTSSILQPYKQFLNGNTFKDEQRARFTIDSSEVPDFSQKSGLDFVKKFITIHKNTILPRLERLERYSQGDNDINYRAKKRDAYASDVRISNPIADYIVTFNQGYTFGKPVRYINQTSAIQSKIEQFQQDNDEQSHNLQMKRAVSTYGVAYELLYVTKDDKSVAQVNFGFVDPKEAFIVYDTSIKPQPLFAVRYFDTTLYQSIEIYTDTTVYYWKRSTVGGQNTADYSMSKDPEEHQFGAVPMNEWDNDYDRIGDFEKSLPLIDAYDASTTEMVNWEADMVNSLLVIKGNPHTGEGADMIKGADGEMIQNPNGPMATVRRMRASNMLVLDNNPDVNGVDPDASYLNKSYDSAGDSAHKDRLMRDILRASLTPDIMDANFDSGGNSQSLRFKMAPLDNKRSVQEGLITKALMNRLKLASSIWKAQMPKLDWTKLSNTDVEFTPNLPTDITNQLNAIQILATTKFTSIQTLREAAASITGVSDKQETDRYNSEDEHISQILASSTGSSQTANDKTSTDPGPNQTVEQSKLNPNYNNNDGQGNPLNNPGGANQQKTSINNK